MTLMLLDFPHIVEESATHLFGVPHGQKHFASSAKFWLFVDVGKQTVFTSQNDIHSHCVPSEKPHKHNCTVKHSI